MTNSDLQDDNVPQQRRFGRRGKLALAGAGLLALGAAAGGVVIAETRPSVSMAPATPVAIRSLTSDSIVTIKGRVAEIYGNKFIMADASGRALVDLGRAGDDDALVTGNEIVTVQGRYDHGFVRAAFLVGPDNKVVALGPLGRPPHDEPHGRHHKGPDDDRRAPAPPAPASAPASAPGTADAAAPAAAGAATAR